MKYLLIIAILFFPANLLKAEISKSTFKVCNESVKIDKDLFKTLAGKDCKCEKCKCDDCKCKGKCDCPGCLKPKQTDPFTYSKALSIDDAYSIVKDGGKVVLFLGVEPTKEDKKGNWYYIKSFNNYKKGIYDCFLQNDECVAQIRSETVDSNCPNGRCNQAYSPSTYYYSNCPNGQCNK